MIAHIIARDKRTSDFGRLARYVVAAQGGIDPATWTRTANYILDTIHQGEKVGGVRVTNCLTQDPAHAAQEILHTQDKNTRSKADKTMHLVIAFPPGEHPPMETLHAIEDALCAAIGFADHQRISAVHVDTEHLHVHLAINKVHPRTLRNVDPWQSETRLMRACDRLEIQYGLERTNHGQDPTRAREVNQNTLQQHMEQPLTQQEIVVLRALHEQAMDREPDVQTLRDVPALGKVASIHDNNEQPLTQQEVAVLRALYEEAIERMPEAQSLSDVPALGSVASIHHGEHDHERTRIQQHYPGELGDITPRDRIVLRESYLEATAEEQAPADVHGLPTLSGSRVVLHAGDATVLLPDHEAHQLADERSAGAELLRRTGAGNGGSRGGLGESGAGQVKRNAPGANNMEAHAGRESFHSWIKGSVGDELRTQIHAAQTWADVHRALAAYDLEIRPRGAGLIIMTREGSAAIKASDLDRAFSIKQLTARFGEYKAPPRAQTVPPKNTYKAAPIHTAPQSDALFLQFQRHREQAMAQRANARNQLRAEHKAYSEQLTSWYANQRQATRGRKDLLPWAKRTVYKQLKAARISDLAKRSQLEKQQLQQINAKHPLPTWQQYLQDAAAQGDVNALQVLRSRAQVAENKRAQWIGARDDAHARQIIFDRLKAEPRKNGDVRYRTSDGGRIIDARTVVRVDRATEEAARAALALALQRFVGESLNVQGDATFKALIVQAAIDRNMAITFTDPVMEAARRRGVTAKAAQAAPPAPAAPKATAAPPVTGAAAQKPFQVAQAVADYVAARNTATAGMYDITYIHRPWTSADTGPMAYQGRRRLSDGTEAILMRSGDAMLVKQVTSAQAAKASRWRVGQSIDVDARGRFTTQDQGKSR